MKPLEPEVMNCSRDSSYGRLLRRLDQALDLARTRQWMAGQHTGPSELEVYGLSEQDLQVLKQILNTMNHRRAAASPSVLAASDHAQQQNHHH